uniref:Uncharacterized protein n=1 Tax=Avena sativa TaxID=4498 RepID=A0ACD5X1R3_AVESA
MELATGAMEPLLRKLGTLMEEEYSYLKTVRKKIGFLQAELGAIHAFLSKMSQVEEPDEQDKYWMKEVEKLSHVIHDSINVFMRLEDDKTKRKGLKGFIIRTMNLLKHMKARRRIAIQVNSLQTLVIEVGDRQARYKVHHYNISRATSSRPMDHNVLDTELPLRKPMEALQAVMGKLTTLLSTESKLLNTTRDKIVFIQSEIEAMHAFLLKMSLVEEPDEHDEYWMKEMQKLSQDIHDSISYFVHPVDDKPAKPKGFISKTATRLKGVRTRHRILTQVDHLHALVTEVGQRHARYKVDYNISKATNSRSIEYDVLEHILDGTMEPTNLPFELLKNITNNFSEEQKIGQGGFGSVYKGILKNGTVAVKRIFNSHTIDVKLFQREVNNLLDVNHENVVRFLGYCASTEEKAMRIEGVREYIYAEMRERILCFEYISNGSLSEHITDELRGLDWNRRYQIIKQICDGLLYLHQEKHILHMDLKPDNILLDDHMMAKITDFGLSRLDENSQTMDSTRYVTFGYCAPEYIHGGKRTFKLDMYSLGVIIIELVTGYKGTPDISNLN